MIITISKVFTMQKNFYIKELNWAVSCKILRFLVLKNLNSAVDRVRHSVGQWGIPQSSVVFALYWVTECGLGSRQSMRCHLLCTVIAQVCISALLKWIINVIIENVILCMSSNHHHTSLSLVVLINCFI